MSLLGNRIILFHSERRHYDMKRHLVKKRYLFSMRIITDKLKNTFSELSSLSYFPAAHRNRKQEIFPWTNIGQKAWKVD